MKILLSGGGSGGPVSPVLAVAEEIKKLKPKTKFLFVGTKKGPERGMVEALHIPFTTVPAAKWRRYVSLKNLLSPFILFFGLVKSLLIVAKFRPDYVFSAGGFVAVPVCWAAWIFGAKIIIHQQDARIGLANKLITPMAHKITAAFEGTAKMFFSGSGLFGGKLKPAADWVGNPVRADLLTNAHNASKKFGLTDNLPTLLVLTGATGSNQINLLIKESLPQLVRSFQVVHQTGKGKNNIQSKDPNYHPYELLDFPDYAWILRKSHIVIARAGLSTLTELSALAKTSIVIPMPNTHQEDNGKILRYTESAVVLTGRDATAENLVRIINKLKFDLNLSSALSINIHKLMPHNAAAKIAKLIINES